MTSSGSFMKEDTAILPSRLLIVKPPMPFEMFGLGQLFRPYDLWAYVKCDDDHVPVRNGAGYRLSAVASCLVPAQDSVLIRTGVSVRLPSSHYGKIEGCSHLGLSHSLVPFGGIIDENYCDEITVKLFNHATTNFVVHRNDCIAQLIIHKYACPSFHRVDDLSNLCSAVGVGSIGVSI